MLATVSYRAGPATLHSSQLLLFRVDVGANLRGSSGLQQRPGDVAANNFAADELLDLLMLLLCNIEYESFHVAQILLFGRGLLEHLPENQNNT